MSLLGGGEDRISHRKLGGGLRALPGNLLLSHGLQTREQGEAFLHEKNHGTTLTARENYGSLSPNPLMKAQTGSDPASTLRSSWKLLFFMRKEPGGRGERHGAELVLNRQMLITEKACSFQGAEGRGGLPISRVPAWWGRAGPSGIT